MSIYKTAGAGLKTMANKEEALMTAAQEGAEERMQRLILQGADVNSTSLTDETALMAATRLEHVNCVRLLVQAGADVNSTDSQGNTALHWAVRNGNMECVKLLIQAGADVNIADDESNTVLIKAGTLAGVDPTKRQSACSVFKLLLKAGAHVNKINSCHQNALQHCIAESHVINEDIVILLYAAGETLDGPTVPRFGVYRSANAQYVNVPDYLLNYRDVKTSLRHMCRQTIRKQLMKFSPVNLFVKIRQLRNYLPKPMLNYLLYSVSDED